MPWGSRPHWRQVGQRGVIEPHWARVAGCKVEWAPLDGEQVGVGWAEGSSSGSKRMRLVGGELDAGRGEQRVVGEDKRGLCK